jgi:cysteine-rich repeat protein
MYDDFENRWIVSTLEITTNPWSSRILLAVSNTGDPNGAWTQTSINTLLTLTGGVHTFGDYPALGLDRRAVYLTTNQYPVSGGPMADARVFVVNKGIGHGGLYDGGSAAVSVLDPPGGGDGNFSLSPAKVYGIPPNAAVGTFLTSYNGLANQQTGDAFLQVLTLLNPLGTPTFQQELVNLGHVDSFANIFPAPQWSGAIGVDTGGRLLQSNTVWRNGFLYVSTELTPPAGPDAGSGTAHWIQLTATAPGQTSVFDQGNVGAEEIAANTRTFWPCVAVNASGALGLGFSISGPSIHPGAGFAFRLPTDPPGTMRSPETLRSGLAYYVYLQNTRNRWGDYTGVDADPSNGCFWAFNEYAMSPNQWGTAWGEKCPDWSCGDGQVDPGETCDPPGSPADPSTLCRASCTSCGDGVLDDKAGESCDDGNHVTGDGCSASCTLEYCGDGNELGAESCDPPNSNGTQPNACRADCSACGDGTSQATRDLIVNGNFESALTYGWSLASAGTGNGAFGLRTPADFVPTSGWPTKPNPDGGSFYAVSDSKSAGTQSMSQAFTIPDDATAVTLQFQMFANNWNSSKNPIVPPLAHPGTFVDGAGLDHTTPNPNQHARVDILRTHASPFATDPASVVSNLFLGADTLSPPANGYKSYSFDLLAKGLVPGESYVLRFAVTHNQAALNLGVDNVRVIVGPGEGCDDGNNAPDDGCQSFCAPCTTAVFPKVVALSHETFSWGLPADVKYVVGDLASVSSLAATPYAITFATHVDLTASPPVGAGLFYLFRYDCPGATWSSGGATEVGDRDAVLP